MILVISWSKKNDDSRWALTAVRVSVAQRSQLREQALHPEGVAAARPGGLVAHAAAGARAEAEEGADMRTLFNCRRGARESEGFCAF